MAQLSWPQILRSTQNDNEKNRGPVLLRKTSVALLSVLRLTPHPSRLTSFSHATFSNEDRGDMLPELSHHTAGFAFDMD